MELPLPRLLFLKFYFGILKPGIKVILWILRIDGLTRFLLILWEHIRAIFVSGLGAAGKSNY